VARYVREHAIRYRVAIDGEFKTWESFGNRAWPSIYLIDRQGVLRYLHVGEGAYEETEREILSLLSEQGGAEAAPPRRAGPAMGTALPAPPDSQPRFEPSATVEAKPGSSLSGSLTDESNYRSILATYVRSARVDYPGLKANRVALDRYLAGVGAVSRDDFDKAAREMQIAYLVNAYNAYTLETIIDNYPAPVKNPGGFFSTGNSIKQIPGRWDTITHKTALGNLTLDNIEHDVLRVRYREPLLHMALVCGSKGCPPLRGEPYTADRLDEQLVDQARAYLSSPYGLVVKDDAIEISSIFDWFGRDFVEKYGSVAGFVERYAPEPVRSRVRSAMERNEYSWIEYDWTLNEQEPDVRDVDAE
jgi:hypothetical protein